MEYIYLVSNDTDSIITTSKRDAVNQGTKLNKRVYRLDKSLYNPDNSLLLKVLRFVVSGTRIRDKV